MDFFIKPHIFQFAACSDFCEHFKPGAQDLVITNEFIYKPYFERFNLPCHVLFQERYGAGEPSDEMVEAMYADVRALAYDRVIAIGGGTVIDIAKLFALRNTSPVVDLFDKKTEAVKTKAMILAPTTCGTGSEITNISILEFKSRQTKFGLAVDPLYADYAVLIPELLNGLPFKFFATSSIDAMIHAIESWLSPKSSTYTRIFAEKAIELIVRGYQTIIRDGQDARLPLLEDFLLASNYAGVSFSNAGNGAVHALSYPLGSKYHIPHGESNYALLMGVLRAYLALLPDGRIAQLTGLLARFLNCPVQSAYDELDALLSGILPRKPLREYGVTDQDLTDFTENVMTRQGRLMANNYTTLTRDDVLAVYKRMY